MKAAFFVIALTAGVAFVGCSSHSSTQEATAACQGLAKTNPAISGDVFKACVACFENCSDCRQQGTSPETFKCPNEDAAGGAGGTGATTSTSAGK